MHLFKTSASSASLTLIMLSSAFISVNSAVLNRYPETEEYRTEQNQMVFGRKMGFDRVRHINMVPQHSLAGPYEPPENLAADMRHSASKEIDESLSGQRRAFINMLNSHQKQPKRKKAINDEDRYIILRFNWKSKRYSITEDEDED